MVELFLPSNTDAGKPPAAPSGPRPPPITPPEVLYCDDCGAPGAKLFGLTHWKLDTKGKRTTQESRLNRRLCPTHEGFRRQEPRITMGEPDPDPDE